MRLERGPAAGLGLDAEPAPEVEDIGRARAVGDQLNPVVGAAAPVAEPCLAEALPDLPSLARVPGDVVPVRVEQPDVLLAGEHQPLAIERRVVDHARDADRAAEAGDEVGLVQLGDARREPCLPIVVAAFS